MRDACGHFAACTCNDPGHVTCCAPAPKKWGPRHGMEPIGPAVTEGLDVERLTEALRGVNLKSGSYSSHAADIAAEYARLSAEHPDD